MFSRARSGSGSIQPYSKEPEGPPEDEQAPAARSDNPEVLENEARGGRLEDMGWCDCGRCGPMDRDVDCLCCRESPAAVAKSDGAPCFTLHPSFEAVCLNRDNLVVVLTAHRQFRNPNTDIHSNE